MLRRHYGGPDYFVLYGRAISLFKAIVMKTSGNYIPDVFPMGRLPVDVVANNALILPYITYCNIVWGNCSSTKINSILLLQKRALRVVTNSHYLSNSEPLFHQLKRLKINDIHTFQTAIFMHKYTFNQLPQSFYNFFTLNSNIHSYPTRRSSDYHLENPKIVLAQKSLKHHGPDVWNSLPENLKLCTSLNSFKIQAKKNILQQYSINS